EDPAGYDWEGGSVPAEPEPLALPAADGAPSSTYDPQRAPEEPRRRPALPAWAIVAIVLLQSAALVASVALVIGGIERITSRGPDGRSEHRGGDTQRRADHQLAGAPAGHRHRLRGP